LARPGGVVTVDWRQPLRPRPDGRFEAAGSWTQEAPKTYPSIVEPKRRTGAVPEPAERAVQAQGQGGQPPESLHLHDQDALREVPCLPPAVQTSVQAGVPDHVVFAVQALQYTRSDGSEYHTVEGLRLSEREAVVVVASRQQGSTTWQVELVRYIFRTTTG